MFRNKVKELTFGWGKKVRFKTHNFKIKYYSEENYANKTDLSYLFL